MQGLVAAVAERNEAQRWTLGDELAAQLIEMVSILRVEALALGGVKYHNLPGVRHIPRPGDEPEKQAVLSPREFAQMTAVM